ncbi:hypothetical protein MJH12_16180 [bacterium]|nr:hypothetical protein [bacterium]
MKQHLFIQVIIISFFWISNSHANTLYKGKALSTFYGFSNVHDFTGQVQANDFKVYQSSDYLNFQVEFVVEKMDTKNSKRNRQMFKMFDHKLFPKFIGKFEKVPLSKVLSQTSFEHQFSINIKDKSYPAIATFKNSKQHENTIEFDLEVNLLLREIGLKAPVMMFGMIKVRDTVKTKTHFTLIKSKFSILKEKIKNQK